MHNSETTFNGPKILFLDIETAPIKAFVWRIWKENVGLNQIEHDWYILSWAAKWAHSDGVFSDALINYKAYYKRFPESDRRILETMWELLDDADIVVTHNGDNFDLTKLNARFIMSDFMPPSPYKSIDTLKIAKARFNFTSNKLDYIATQLGVGSKLPHTGFKLWSDCLDGQLEAWDMMVKYNKQDVRILEAVYNRFKGWTKTHPNYGLYVDDLDPMCTKCGSKELSLNGYSYTTVGKFQRYLCKNCGASPRGRSSVLSKEKRKTLLTNTI